MPVPPAIRSFLPLIVGLVIGGAGVGLFRSSLTGAEGSAEMRAARLEVQLKATRNRLAAFEAADPYGRRRPGRSFGDRARGIAEDIREGRPVTPDDVFRLFQPVMRDLAPLFDRIRVLEQKKEIESKLGELTRKYDLNSAQQESLRNWFAQKAKESADRYNDLVMQDGTRLQDLMKEAMNDQHDEGMDDFMAKTLTGEKLAAYRTESGINRAARVQREADGKVERLNNIVQLTDSQRDSIFGIMARSSPDYDPAMKLEGADGVIAETAGANPQEAMLSVLTAEQRSTYEAERRRRFDEQRMQMEAVGLTMPDDWELLDESEF